MILDAREISAELFVCGEASLSLVPKEVHFFLKRLIHDARPPDDCDPESDALDRMTSESIEDGGDGGVRLAVDLLQALVIAKGLGSRVEEAWTTPPPSLSVDEGTPSLASVTLLTL